MPKLTISTQDVRPLFCKKCGLKRPLYRHHMGNDGLLGRFSRKIAREYAMWLDCVYICDPCHMEIHYIYETMVTSLWGDFSPSGAMRLRQECIKSCKQWLDGLLPTPEIPKEFKDTWQTSFKKWRERKDHPAEIESKATNESRETS